MNGAPRPRRLCLYHDDLYYVISIYTFQPFLDLLLALPRFRVSGELFFPHENWHAPSLLLSLHENRF